MLCIRSSDLSCDLLCRCCSRAEVCDRGMGTGAAAGIFATQIFN